MGADPRGEHQREQPDDHRQRGHEDGAKTRYSTLDGSLVDAEATLAALDGELYDEDSVLRQQTDEHDQSDLRIDIIGVAEELHEEVGAEEAEGDRQDDRQRQHVALVLSAQDEVDEEQAEAEDQRRRIGGLLLGARQPRIVVAVARGQRLGRDLRDRLEDVPRSVAWGGSSHHVDGGVEVEAVDARRAVHLLGRDEARDGRHLPAARAYVDAG